MRFKRHANGDSAVALPQMQPQTVIAIMVADQVWREMIGRGCIVTSINDGKHMAGSLHYTGFAVDLRTTGDGIDADQAHALMNEIHERLTDEYDIVFEGDHIHIEYDPD